MTAPLMVLAVLSIVAGYLGIPAFLEPVFHGEGGCGPSRRKRGLRHHGGGDTMGLSGIAAAYYLYVLNLTLPDRL